MMNNFRDKKNITVIWKNHFDRLLNSSCDNRKRSCVLNALKCSDLLFTRFTIADTINVSLKNGKATGLTDVYEEHFKYADDKIAALL